MRPETSLPGNRGCPLSTRLSWQARNDAPTPQPARCQAAAPLRAGIYLQRLAQYRWTVRIPSEPAVRAPGTTAQHRMTTGPREQTMDDGRWTMGHDAKPGGNRYPYPHRLPQATAAPIRQGGTRLAGPIAPLT